MRISAQASESALQASLLLTGRALLSFIFISAGVSKIADYAATQGYMEGMGVPGGLLPLVIALELGAGTAVLLGWGARLGALALAGFSVAAAVLFHGDLADQLQSILFTKNLAIAGGLLLVSAHGPGGLALERLFAARRPLHYSA
jgi:putative oxidoreductase